MRFIFIILLFLSFSSFSQTNDYYSSEKKLVGKASLLTSTIAEMHVSGKTYTISYSDLNYQRIKVLSSKNNEIKSFSFDDIDNEFEKLYNSIIEFIENKELKTKSFELKTGSLTLEKQLKTTCFIFKDRLGITSRSGYMNKKLINNLFGKN